MADLFKALRSRFAVAPESFLVTRRHRERVQEIVRSVGEDATVLNVGAGYTRLSPRVINVEIFDSGETDVLASALALPFKREIADLVVLQGVMEHVEDAHQVIAECQRVLKPGGLLYLEVPFLQPYHECPIDMRRCTMPGLRQLCAPLEPVDAGIHIGPASTFAWFLREFLAAFISCGRQPLYRRCFTIVGWFTWPIKYADLYLERIPALFTVASSCWYLGRKVQAPE